MVDHTENKRWSTIRKINDGRPYLILDCSKALTTLFVPWAGVREERFLFLLAGAPQYILFKCLISSSNDVFTLTFDRLPHAQTYCHQAKLLTTFESGAGHLVRLLEGPL